MNRTPLFFEAYRQTGSVTAAAAAAGVNRSRHYDRVRKDKAYRRAWELLRQETLDRMVYEAGQRAQQLQRLEIAKPDARMQALEDRWHQLRLALARITGERGDDMADVPGGQSGFLARDFKGKDATQEIYRVDSGIISLVIELRAIERQAAEQLGQWVSKSEHVGADGGPIATKLEIVLVDAPANGV
jgi:hypothetical protein